MWFPSRVSRAMVSPTRIITHPATPFIIGVRGINFCAIFSLEIAIAVVRKTINVPIVSAKTVKAVSALAKLPVLSA